MGIGTARRAAIALFVVALLVAGGASAFYLSAPARAASTAVTTDASGTLQVTAEGGYAFTPSTFQQLPVNATISVTFTDNDVDAHTFTIIGKQGWVIPSDYSSAQINALAFGHSPAALVNLNASSVGTPGDIQYGNFTVTAPGWYEFVCTEPGHFQNGMYGFIAIGMNLPPNLTVSAANTGPGIAVFIIVGTIVGLVVIALVLGFVVGRRRGDVYEMPPQRLGYPEPGAPEAPAPAEAPIEPKG
ncbi:MAG TPA: plastocyanin/azurin family copper-binding protein [Thermoplasmata archaeon]|nr:plastocyanin/azurin family copper-binding protein [Thermoplasmata archaeon]